IPGDMNDRAVGALADVRTWAFGPVPAGSRNLAPPGSLRHRVLHQLAKTLGRNMAPEHKRPSEDLGLGAVTRLLNELPEALVGYRVAVNPEGVERNFTNWALAVSGESVGIIRAHEEWSAGQRDHIFCGCSPGRDRVADSHRLTGNVMSSGRRAATAFFFLSNNVEAAFSHSL